jgi:glutathione S-transferase
MHPLASFCHKVLIALYENETPFEPLRIDKADSASTARLREHWPVGKIPVLHDSSNDRVIAETSIIIEYLDQHYPGPVPMLPQDRDAALEVRLWDRFFDLYVSVPMQKIVADRLRPETSLDPFGVEEARSSLDLAYTMIETQLSSRMWACGNDFTMADCAAAPALFYAAILQPFTADTPALSAYFERLMARPSVVRVIDEARPYFHMFPYQHAMPPRFLQG